MSDQDPAPPHVHDLHGTGAGAPASKPTHPPKLAGATDAHGKSPIPPVVAAAFTDHGTYTPTRAMEDVMAERWRQIHTFGHTPEADQTKSPFELYGVVRRYAKACMDYLSCHGPRDVLRKMAVKQAAAILAFIDRLDADEI